MENEETSLVHVREVEADLIFDPDMDKSLVGYGSRKIIRKSLKTQLGGGYKCLDYDAIEPETKIKKFDSNVIIIVDVLIGGIYSKKEIAEKTQLTETQVGYVLNALRKHGLVEVIKLRRMFYYKILLDE